MNYQIDFVIPQGPTGPQGLTGATGPTGPSGESAGLQSYGGRYSNISQTLNLVVETATQIPLATTMPNKNTAYTTANSINIQQDGVYEINYFSNMTTAVDTTVTMAVRSDGTNIPATVTSKALSVGVSSIYSGSVIVNLTAGATIDLAISALVAAGITLGTDVNASLSVKKLN